MRSGSGDLRGGLESKNADACTSVPVPPCAPVAFSTPVENSNDRGAVRLVGKISLWPSMQQEWSELWEPDECGIE